MRDGDKERENEEWALFRDPIVNAQTHEKGGADSVGISLQLMQPTSPGNEAVEEGGQEDRATIDKQEFELGDLVGSLAHCVGCGELGLWIPSLNAKETKSSPREEYQNVGFPVSSNNSLRLNP